MALKYYECTECGEQFRTKKEKPQHCDKEAKQLLVAPQTKMVEKVDPERGKTQMVDQDKILRERARAHSRDVDMDYLITNNPREDAVKNGWVNDKGERRKKVDDI